MEIDAKTLVHQLNQLASDLPGSVVNRWLLWIRLFDFDLKHIAETKYGGPDALSRRSKGSDSEDEGENDIEDEIDAALSLLFHSNTRPKEVPGMSDTRPVDTEEDEEEEDEEQIPENFHKVIRYLTDFKRPEGLTRKKYLQFQKYATGFLLRDGMLFKRSKPNILPKRVIWHKEERREIIRKLYDKNGHKGRQGTYSKIALYY